MLAELRRHPRLTHHPLLPPKMTPQPGGPAQGQGKKANSAREKKKRRSRSGDRRRVKEADTVTLLTLPNVVGFGGSPSAAPLWLPLGEVMKPSSGSWKSRGRT